MLKANVPQKSIRTLCLLLWRCHKLKKEVKSGKDLIIYRAIAIPNLACVLFVCQSRQIWETATFPCVFKTWTSWLKHATIALNCSSWHPYHNVKQFHDEFVLENCHLQAEFWPQPVSLTLISSPVSSNTIYWCCDQHWCNCSIGLCIHETWV